MSSETTIGRARSLDGATAADAIKGELRIRVERLRRAGIVPGLGTLLVGDDPVSVSYVTSKHRDCESVGVHSTDCRLPVAATEADVLDAVDALNADPTVTGFIVQLPLPGGVDETRVLERVRPDKDADGLHPTNLGRLVLGVHDRPSGPMPCTPAGIVELLDRHGIDLVGKHVVVIGRGITVGRPLGLLLSRKGVDATVTLAHSRTADLPTLVRSADVIVAAVGVPHLVDASWVSPGAVVVDVGVTRVGTTSSGRAKISGDVAPAVAEVADWISPNPGGVGPMTRVMLLTNVVGMAERASESEEGTPKW